MESKVRYHIPYDQLETLFLDVGNTLVSMDFSWIREELAHRGVECDVVQLVRAEAATRPIISARLAQRTVRDDGLFFEVYLGGILTKLEAMGVVMPRPPAALVAELAPVLRAPGRTQRLWSNVLPGVREALRALREVGLQLVVVSNSDGTVESGLTAQGLRPYFDAVLDSHVVGFEKPDSRIFLRALEVSDANPERTLHVGDLYEIDVVGARAAGLHALLLDPYGDWVGVDCARLPDLASLQRQVVASIG